MAKHWPWEPGTITIGGEQIDVTPIALIDGIRQVLGLWGDPGKAGEASVLLDIIQQPRDYQSSAAYNADTSRLGDAATYAVIGIRSPDGRQYCIDTLKELVP